MNINKQIEMNLTDTLTEKPFRFRVGKGRYSIFPATLGKMQLLKNLYLTIGIDYALLTTNPLAEAFRICRQHPDIVSQIIALSTLRDKQSIMDSEKVLHRAEIFRKELDVEDLATVFSLILSADNTEEFIKYFGIDAERSKRMQISRIKGDGNSLTFGGKSIYGLVIDFACQRYGWTLDYILWGISQVNLNLLMADAITNVYLSDEERKKLGLGVGETVDAEDPNNRDLLRKLISDYQ